jgi:sporulation protein YlmC with PRC-barrel domain
MKIRSLGSLCAVMLLLVGGFGPSAKAQESRPADDRHTVAVLNRLLGVEVHNAEGVHLGELDDIALSPQGELRYAIIGTGGVLDLGEDHVAVPFSQLKVDWSQSALALDLTRDRLMATPRLKQQGYKELDDPAWMAKFSDSYSLGGDLDLSEEQASATLDTKIGVQVQADPKQNRLTYGKLRSVHLASDLIGSTVVDKAGKEVAEVEYLVANKQADRVAMLILGKGGVLDVGETLIPIPWQAAQPKELKTKVVVGLNVAGDQLQQAPRVSGEFPALLDSTFIERVHRHYGVQRDK